MPVAPETLSREATTSPATWFFPSERRRPSGGEEIHHVPGRGLPGPAREVTQLDTYLRCPLRHGLQLSDRVELDLAPGRPRTRPGFAPPPCSCSGEWSAAGADAAAVQAYSASLWALETTHRRV